MCSPETAYRIMELLETDDHAAQKWEKMRAEAKNLEWDYDKDRECRIRTSQNWTQRNKNRVNELQQKRRAEKMTQTTIQEPIIDNKSKVEQAKMNLKIIRQFLLDTMKTLTEADIVCRHGEAAITLVECQLRELEQ